MKKNIKIILLVSLIFGSFLTGGYTHAQQLTREEMVAQLIEQLWSKIRALQAQLAQEQAQNSGIGATVNKENIKNNVGPKNYTLPADAYTVDLESWNISNNRSDAVTTTNNLQSAINWAVENKYSSVIIPQGHYLIGKYGNDIYQAGIELPSNISLILEPNTTIEMAGNNKWNYCAIAINNKQNVEIIGGTIIGDRYNHTYTPRKTDRSKVHDEGHLICIQGEHNNNINIENILLKEANGDGILIVGSPKGKEQKPQNITIKYNEFSNNRRQGISLVGSANVTIEHNEIHHTHGTSPQFGIDLEGAGRINKDISIKKNYFHNNKGGDIVNTDGINILVEENIFEQGDDSSYIDGPLVYWKNAQWTVKNNDITMRTTSVNNWNGIIMYSNDHKKTNTRTSELSHNTCNNCGFYTYKGSDLVVKNNYFNKGHLAFWKMSNLVLENNKVEHPQKCWAYRFLEVSGRAQNNTYNNNFFPIPLSSTP